MEKDIAIKVENISKTFKVPHERINSVKGIFVNMFNKKTYETFKALDSVSLEVKKGEFLGIIGRNGSGKSTLLKILAGVYQADDGKVKITGRISPFLELGIGFNPELSGRDNIYLNATILGLTKNQIQRKFDEIVSFSELERFIDQKVRNYSSGMRVRLAFSVALHARRDILIMDEVLAVGDSNFQSKCINEFIKYKELGRTVILVTHSTEVVQRYCDRAILLKNGKVKREGNVDDVTNEYVFDNIQDENKRVDTVKKGKTEESKEGSDYIAKISKVDFFNSSNEQSEIFNTGENLEARIYFNVRKDKCKSFNIGFSIESEKGDYIFGCTTAMDNYNTDACNNNVSIVFKNIPFLKGLYNVNATIFGKNEGEIFDFNPKINKFSIISKGTNNLYKGNVNLEHMWK